MDNTPETSVKLLKSNDLFRQRKTEAIVLGFEVRPRPDNPNQWYWMCGDGNCLPLIYASEEEAWMAAILALDAAIQDFRADSIHVEQRLLIGARTPGNRN